MTWSNPHRVRPGQVVYTEIEPAYSGFDLVQALLMSLDTDRRTKSHLPVAVNDKAEFAPAEIATDLHELFFHALIAGSRCSGILTAVPAVIA